METEIIEPDWENCEYCSRSYYEYDTGYAEYSCDLDDNPCSHGCLEYGCPLAFKYTRED